MGSAILLMCEGTTEKAFLDILSERCLLRWKESDLLALQIFQARQLEGELERLIGLVPQGVEIYRVGDKFTDELRKPRNPALRPKILSVRKVLTKPEFEVLFLLWQGEWAGSSKEKPSIAYKKIDPAYRKTEACVRERFERASDQELIALLKLYREKRFGAHEKDELCLYDLLREDLKK